MIALAVDVMFFAVLVGAFFVLREGAPTWPANDMLAESPRTATAIAISLLASSLFLSLTVRAQHYNRLKRFRTFLSASLLFLAIALTFSIAELRSFLSAP